MMEAQSMLLTRMRPMAYSDMLPNRLVSLLQTKLQLSLVNLVRLLLKSLTIRQSDSRHLQLQIQEMLPSRSSITMALSISSLQRSNLSIRMTWMVMVFQTQMTIAKKLQVLQHKMLTAVQTMMAMVTATLVMRSRTMRMSGWTAMGMV